MPTAGIEPAIAPLRVERLTTWPSGHYLGVVLKQSHFDHLKSRDEADLVIVKNVRTTTNQSARGTSRGFLW